jgi:hypothetical protein
LRSGVGGRLLGRGPPCRRGAILDHMGREKVGCCWLSAITLHAVIMQPPAAASNLDTTLGSLLRAEAENTSQKTTPSTMKKLGAKVPTRVAYLPDGGLGLGVSGAPLQPGYTHRLVVLPGGLGNLGRPTEPRFQWIAAKHHIDKFDEMTVMMFLFFQAKERSKRQGGSSWWSPRPTIIRLWNCMRRMQ